MSTASWPPLLDAVLEGPRHDPAESAVDDGVRGEMERDRDPPACWTVSNCRCPGSPPPPAAALVDADLDGFSGGPGLAFPPAGVAVLPPPESSFPAITCQAQVSKLASR